MGVKLNNLPTSAAACFAFNVDAWTDISVERANFRWLKLAGDL
jgi:hypothetical protein